MQKIMFNDRYGLTDAVLDGRKTMTRRIIPKDIAETLIIEGDDIFPDIPCEGLMKYSRYKVGEEVAIAQKYWDLRNDAAFYEALAKADPSFPIECIKGEKGCNNKMFVKASWMPHRIRITDIRVERLQDISDEDCLREGVVASNCKTYFNGYAYDWVCDQYGDILATQWFKTPREAFAGLIDKVSGKGTWESNPYVWVYSFELIK